MSFWKKFQAITKKNKSFVCVGLDSDFSRLPDCVQNEDDPMFAFNKKIIDATKNYVAAYKPNYAFYASQGTKGLASLYKTLDYIPEEIPVVLDVKVGDIGNTMKHYAKAYFETLNVDSITVNPLMGHDVLSPLEPYEDKMFFILALTSNPTASDYLKQNGLAQKIATNIHKMNPENAGAVVGATNVQELQEIRGLMPKTIFLIPGIGAQGGSIEEVMRNAISSKDDPRILINSSRGIIFAENSENFAEVAKQKTIALRDNINQYL